MKLICALYLSVARSLSLSALLSLSLCSHYKHGDSAKDRDIEYYFFWKVVPVYFGKCV